MNNYCPKCQKSTEDKVHISEKLGLKPNRRYCNVECKICGVVKFSGTLEEHDYVDYTKGDINE